MYIQSSNLGKEDGSDANSPRIRHEDDRFKVDIVNGRRISVYGVS